MCAALTLVCFYRTCRRLVVRVTGWGVALRGIMWAILAFALVVYSRSTLAQNRQSLTVAQKGGAIRQRF